MDLAGAVTAAQVLLGGEVFGTDTSDGNGQYTGLDGEAILTVFDAAREAGLNF